MAVWEIVHACDFTHSWKLHNVQHYSNVQHPHRTQKNQPVEMNRSQKSCTDLYEMVMCIYISLFLSSLKVNVDEHQSFHGLDLLFSQTLPHMSNTQ